MIFHYFYATYLKITFDKPLESLFKPFYQPSFKPSFAKDKNQHHLLCDDVGRLPRSIKVNFKFCIYVMTVMTFLWF